MGVCFSRVLIPPHGARKIKSMDRPPSSQTRIVVRGHLKRILPPRHAPSTEREELLDRFNRSSTLPGLQGNEASCSESDPTDSWIFLRRSARASLHPLAGATCCRALSATSRASSISLYAT